MGKVYILGIDTSNYKTSIAVTDEEGTIVADERQLLKVREGERGLRQQEALFQHVENLPVLYERIMQTLKNKQIAAVAVSTRPRPVEGSYMPCFKAGITFGKAVALSLNVPFYEFSHQEGHLQAAKGYSELKDSEDYIGWHLSGGTCEVLSGKENLRIIGGSKDISFGQVIDRAGVAMGFPFPAGSHMDRFIERISADEVKEMEAFLAGRYHVDLKLSPIKIQEGWFNLSGMETQCQRIIEKLQKLKSEENEYHTACKVLTFRIFERTGEAIEKVSLELCRKFAVKSLVFSGGVSESLYIRKHLKDSLEGRLKLVYSPRSLSEDNGVGIALLGGKAYEQDTHKGFTTE